MANWQSVRHVKKGEPLSAGVISRPDRGLEARTEYLKDRVDAADLSQALFAFDQTVESTVLVGQPVYWNAQTVRFEAALAASESDSSGALVAAASADAVGIVYKKTNDTLADILLFGKAKVDLTNAVDGDVKAGRYYLSSSQAGHLTQQKPGVSVPILVADGAGNVIVTPGLKDFAESHVHYSFDLEVRPAGKTSPPPPGGRHTIEDADASIRGWLPADHPTFAGKAPPLAVFGYNLAMHESLKNVWPPVPLDAVSIVWDKGLGGTGGTVVPLGRNGLVTVDAAGIWWMSDCFGDVPWPADYDNTGEGGSGVPGSSSSQTIVECPRIEQMSLKIHFARMSYATDHDVVSELVADDGTLEITDDSGNVEAKSGRLRIRFVESMRQSLIQAQIASMTGAGLATLNGMTYYGMPVAVNSEIEGWFKIQETGLPTSPQLRVRLRIFGQVNGTLPKITLLVRILPQPDSNSVPIPSESSEKILVTELGVNGKEYLEVTSEAIPVEPSDTLWFVLKRDATDSYPAEVGILPDIVGVVESGVA